MTLKRIRCVLVFLVETFVGKIFCNISIENPFLLSFLQLLNELSRMQSSVSEHQERSQRLQQETRRQLQEKEQTIKAQREQVSFYSQRSLIMWRGEVRQRVSPRSGYPVFAACAQIVLYGDRMILYIVHRDQTQTLSCETYSFCYIYHRNAYLKN